MGDGAGRGYRTPKCWGLMAVFWLSHCSRRVRAWGAAWMLASSLFWGPRSFICPFFTTSWPPLMTYSGASNICRGSERWLW